MQNSHNRINNYHGTKRQLLGGSHGPAPAWKPNATTPNTMNGRRAVSSNLAQPSEPGSKILLSRLPSDVSEQEVTELFNKTVGPTNNVFLIFNSQGHPKGMAVVSFQRATDAALAKEKYNGKIVDGKRPIKIELIVNDVPTSGVKQTVAAVVATPAPQAPSLLDRMKIPPANGAAQQKGPKKVPTAPAAAEKPKPQPTKRGRRTRKGPARLKRRAVSAEDLDHEMDVYRASGPAAKNDFIIFPPKQETVST